ncbi:hypothetical protein HMPREF1624_07753 [Sporothrix schenckii ATCC 58251]|uniref:Chromo domain-containing protein n=1 Tax=Sporothrix schenckii (strain ATCC 58251 / de Perez 2211183) TaxID=1391915 RepID=U7PLQ6_SPOS1|nr:hypothetical protein HMPREF1624_07753 [Sporothrix schenckii ATCC 58251]
MPRPRRVEPLPPSSTTPTSLCSTPASSSQRHRRPELRVLLYDKPRYRVQAHAPRPPPTPISLVPPRNDDYGAFIVDKVVTPLDWGGPPAVGTAADLRIRPGGDDDDDDVDDDDGYNTDEEEAREDERYRQDPRRQHVKRVLNYVVGWPDEPYARHLVPCTQILDYVSPRVVEDWEYALTERQRAAREARRAEKAAKKKGTQTTQATQGALIKTKHEEDGATGGLSHKRRPGRPPQTAAATAARVAAAAARKAAAQGLPSTPAKMASLQIQLDSMPASTPMGVGVSIGGPSPKLFSSPGSAEKQHAGPSLKRPFQKFVEQQKADESESRGASLGVDTATTTTTNTSANSDEGNGDENDDDNDDDELQGPATNQPHAMVMLPSLREPPVLYEPLPQQPLPRPSTYIPPPDTPLYNPPMNRPQVKGPSTATPIPLPPTAQAQPSLKRKRNEETPIPPPTIPIATHPAKDAIAVLPLPGPAPAPRDEDGGDDDEADDLYEVDRLEGDCLTAVDADGHAVVDEPVDWDDPLHQPPPGSRVVRLFLVRWKGDWPPDQNPSWEPAENLPPRMVRQYLKHAAHKQARRGSKGAGEQRAARHSMA